jgi:hypothetical protein
MATREAALRVTIRNAGFLAGMRQMTAVAATTGAKMGAALSGPMKAGLASAAGTMKTMMGGLAGHMKTVASLGGAFAVGKFLSDAVKMQTAYRNIAHNVNKISDGAVDWKTIQASIAPIADKTGQTVQDMATSFDTVFQATGDLEYTKKAMEAIGTAATASGEDATKYAQAMQLADRKFGVGVNETEAAVAAFDAKIGIGGAGIDDLNNKFAVMAGEASAAGMSGVTGMNQLLGVMLKLDSSIGEKASPGLKAMFQYLKNNTAQLKKLEKDASIKFEPDMTAFEKIRAMLQSEKGRVAAEMTFTADRRVVYDTLAQPFQDAYKQAVAQGKSTKEATQIGLKAFDKSIQEMSGSTGKFSNLQEQAAQRMKEDPSVIMRKALNKMATAFQDDKMLGAIEKMAKILPGVADGFVKLLDWVMNNPLLAAGGYVGARVGISFAQGALINAGTKIGASAGTWLNKVAPTAGAKMGLAAKVALVGAAAMIGFYIGKKIADAFWSERESLEKGAQQADITATNALASKNVEDQKAALEKVRSQIAAIKESQSGMLGGLKQFYYDASAAGAAAVGSDVGYVDTQADALAKLQRAQADLQSSIQKQEQAQNKGASAADRAGNSMDRLARSAEKLDKALQGVGDAPGSAPGGKGPPGRLHTGPGYAQ